ncbi:hypothetical protein MKX01_012532, partial [Papaver californicum]
MASWFSPKYGLRSILRLPRTLFSASANRLHKNNEYQQTNINDDKKNGFQGKEDDKDGFNPGAPPPFKIAEIRNAIPKHCWIKNPWRSMSYVVRDILVVAALAASAEYFNNWVFWIFYWAAQGTMFWAIFVLGHDCGHGSFSNSQKLNSIVGHLLHSFILVPYNG